MNPEDLKYAKTHEWVAVEDRDGQKIATVGISAFALQQLTDLVYLELPEVGRTVSAGDSFGEIESVKAVSDLYAPVTGEVIEVDPPRGVGFTWAWHDEAGARAFDLMRTALAAGEHGRLGRLDRDDPDALVMRA